MSNVIKQPQISNEIYLLKLLEYIQESQIKDVNNLTSVEGIERSHKDILKKITNAISQLKDEYHNLQVKYDALKKDAEDICAKTKEEEERRKNIKAEIILLEKTLSDLKENIKDIEKKGYEDGYTKGVKEGEQNAKNSVLQKLQDVLNEIDKTKNTLHEIVEKTLRERELFIKNNENEILNLSLAIAKKIIREEITLNQKVILSTLKDAIERVKSRDKIKIKVHPDDLTTLSNFEKNILHLKDIVEEVKFIPDEKIEKGGCIIDTDLGIIDATISSQIEEIEKAIT